MIKPIDTAKLKTAKIVMVAFFLGAVCSALLLDNRASAIYKAFMNPIAVNAASFTTEVKAK